MKRTPFFSVILLLAGWFFFQSTPIDYVDVAENPVPTFASSCDSLPLECQGTAVSLQAVDNNGDGILDTGLVAIWVEDLLVSPEDNCPGSYSVNVLGAPQDPDQDSLFFGCYDVGTEALEVWRYDTLGNEQGVCTTFVIVQDNLGICIAEPLQLNGNITTPNGMPVPGVRLELDWRELDIDSTGEDGEYGFFEQAYYGEPVSIKPIREGDELNGVSTLDLVLISKHILGVEVFDSYTQYIAADINRSGSITLLDLIQLRRLILQQEGFDNNTSWRFIPTDQDHWGAGSVVDWNSIPEEINLYDIESEGLPIYTVDFLAVKIGDLDGSAMP